MNEGVEIETSVASDEQLTGAQAASLREALSNLLLNAVQATERGGLVRIEAKVEPWSGNRSTSRAGLPPSLEGTDGSSIANYDAPGSDNKIVGDRTGRTGSYESERKLIITVTDTGPGIAAEDQVKVFEPFYTTKSRGTGLGIGDRSTKSV